MNCPLTSSAGRLFDAVSSLLGVCHKADYEGQGGILLENIGDESERGSYAYEIKEGDGISFRLMFLQILEDIRNHIEPSFISMKFHRTLGDVILKVCSKERERTGIHTVAFSGGVFQNRLLLGLSEKLLIEHGFTVLTHSNIPCNDGGLSLGQGAIAYYREGL